MTYSEKGFKDLKALYLREINDDQYIQCSSEAMVVNFFLPVIFSQILAVVNYVLG